MEEPKDSRSHRYCCICKKKNGSMFGFPKNPEQYELWKRCLGIVSAPDHLRVCAGHFRPEDIKTGNGHTRLVKNAKPSVNMPESQNPESKGHSCHAHLPSCVASGCKTKAGDGISLHMFPRLFEQRRQWASLLGIAKVPSRWTLICSSHFLPSDFHVKGTLKTLKATATPSINRSAAPSTSHSIGNEHRTSQASNDDIVPQFTDGESRPECIVPDSGDIVELASRIQSAGPSHDGSSVSNQKANLEETTCIHDESVGDVEDDQGQGFEGVISTANECDAEELASVFERVLSTLKSDINYDVNSPLGSSVNLALSSKNCPSSFCGNSPLSPAKNSHSSFSSSHSFSTMRGRTYSQNSPSFGRSTSTESCGTQTDMPRVNIFDFLCTDIQLKAFAGVTFATFNCLHRLVLELCGKSDKCEVLMKNKILLTLCKLRLNLSYECLSVLVGIKRRLCGSYFASTLHLLATVLKHTVYWPSKQEILLNMPTCFQPFKDTRVILYCIEVPVLSPDCLKCRIHLFSHHKGCTTVKVLVGVAPSGLITFVSSVYGGRASDEQIFEECDLISKKLLEPYVDAVIVDKRFTVDSVCNERGIKIYRPFAIEKKQPLSESNAFRNAEIASARGHVERVVKRMKIFKILQSKLAWSTSSFLDDIFIIIAGLVNLSPPILEDSEFLTCEQTSSTDLRK